MNYLFHELFLKTSNSKSSFFILHILFRLLYFFRSIFIVNKIPRLNFCRPKDNKCNSRNHNNTNTDEEDFIPLFQCLLQKQRSIFLSMMILTWSNLKNIFDKVNKVKIQIITINYFFRLNYTMQVFDVFTLFETSWRRFDYFNKMLVCLYGTQILWPLWRKSWWKELHEILHLLAS